MRDNKKDLNYFQIYIKHSELAIVEDLRWLKDGKVKSEREATFKRSIADAYVGLIISKYSANYTLHELKLEYATPVRLINESWDGFWKLKNKEGKEYDQYILSAYDEMLWMLSLGYLLNVPESDFKKLVDVVDRDNVKDNLFEFIISAKIKDRALRREESYKEFFGVPEVFSKLREAIRETDKTKAGRLIKDFLEKDWYKNHEDAGWYNSHKSKHDTYFGYWSFESAAVVKIMGLDDSSFRDNQYYPKDLVQA